MSVGTTKQGKRYKTYRGTTKDEISMSIHTTLQKSDYTKQAEVMVNKSGQHRISYTGKGSGARFTKRRTSGVTLRLSSNVMALSKPVVRDTGQDKSVIVQNYLECGTEDCEKNCQFYCNDCHQPMCEQCRDEHQKSPETKNHEVVHYRQHKRNFQWRNAKIIQIKI
uniref:Uncharacterized protein n=1 Tax=Magallana gigas TaxID=29159 RepID=K1RCG0_MAGGI